MVRLVGIACNRRRVDSSATLFSESCSLHVATVVPIENWRRLTPDALDLVGKVVHLLVDEQQGLPSQLRTQSVRNPSLKGAAATGLASGAEVTVSFPGVDRRVAQYSFTADDITNKAAPSVVLVTHGATPAFVNNGRHLLRDYEVAFDADGGWFGFRKVVP